MTTPAIATLLATLDLDAISPDVFQGSSPEVGWQRVFGGQVVAQALIAACRTVVAPFQVHSLHGYFLRPGDPAVPIIYEVTRERDGKSFHTRRVAARQKDVTIFVMAASFARPEDGFDHQLAMPVVPPPESLPSERELLERFADSMPAAMRRYFTRARAIELKPAEPEFYIAPRAGRGAVQHVWLRPTGPLPADPLLHTAVLAYASDLTLIDTALVAHGRNLFDPGLMLASLDHAMWFHRPVVMDDWILYAQDAPSASGGRGFNRGSLFARDGRLIASVAQEGLIRQRRPELP